MCVCVCVCVSLWKRESWNRMKCLTAVVWEVWDGNLNERERVIGDEWLLSRDWVNKWCSQREMERRDRSVMSAGWEDKYTASSGTRDAPPLLCVLIFCTYSTHNETCLAIPPKKSSFTYFHVVPNPYYFIQWRKGIFQRICGLAKRGSAWVDSGSTNNLQQWYLWPVLGKVTFKSNALQYCVTP